jgi:hypothetical protein
MTCNLAANEFNTFSELLVKIQVEFRAYDWLMPSTLFQPDQLEGLYESHCTPDTQDLVLGLTDFSMVNNM